MTIMQRPDKVPAGPTEGRFFALCAIGGFDVQSYPNYTHFVLRFLLLKYNKSIKKERLVKETIDDMKGQKKLSKIKINGVFSEVLKSFIDFRTSSSFFSLRINGIINKNT